MNYNNSDENFNQSGFCETEVRLALRRNGYHPIPVEGKKPPLEEWEKKLNTTDEEIRFWATEWRFAFNTGVIAKFTPGLDIDILSPDAALAREHFEERGDILVRIGLSPKRFIPLRTDEPFAKLKCKFVAPNGMEHQIEVLGNGQQWVAHGIHEDTGEPYRWFGGELITTKCEALPCVQLADVQKFLNAAVKLLVEEFGYVLKDTSTDDGEPHEPGEPQAAVERIAAALAVIPNNEDWDGWNRIGMATWRATGGSPEGLAAFDAWSKKSPKYDASNTAKKWSGYFKSPPTHIGAGTIIHLADRASPYWYQGEPPSDPDPPPPEPEPGPPPRATGALLFNPWQRYIVPDFPLQVLSPTVRNYVTSQALVIGCDPAAMAMSALTGISGAIDHRCAVKMQRISNSDWWEHARLWTLLVGDPSVKKTPPIDAVSKPLEQYQDDLRRDYEARLRDYEAGVKEGDEKAEEPDPPVRYVVWNTTPEKLGEILLAQRPRHVCEG